MEEAPSPKPPNQAALDKEEADLAQAERMIAEGEQRVAEQNARIAALAADGHDIARSERLLRTFQATLAQWRAFRDEIVVARDRAQKTLIEATDRKPPQGPS